MLVQRRAFSDLNGVELQKIGGAGLGSAVPVEAEPDSRGFADYVLYAQNGRPLAVIEAKKRAFDPYIAKQQARPYAKQLDAPFIFLTNGEFPSCGNQVVGDGLTVFAEVLSDLGLV